MLVGTKADTQSNVVKWAEADAFSKKQCLSCFETRFYSGKIVLLIYFTFKFEIWSQREDYYG